MAAKSYTRTDRDDRHLTVERLTVEGLVNLAELAAEYPGHRPGTRMHLTTLIPPLGCRTHKRRYSRALYKGRNVVERFWNKVKQYRRVATRYDKLDACYLAFVHLASVLTVLKHP